MMRKYYLFVIRDEISKTYENNLKELYINLYQVYKGRISNCNYRISLFNQICIPFRVNIIKNYLNYLLSIRKNGKKYLYRSNREISLMEVTYPTVVIISNRNLPYFFKVLNLYNKKIMVCDFENGDYFWLSNQYKLKTLEYN